MSDRAHQRPRGVRLGDLDRGVLYVLGYTGRRWEVLGPLGDDESVGTRVRTHAGGPDEVGSTAAYAPRHAAPTALEDEEAPDLGS